MAGDRIVNSDLTICFPAQTIGGVDYAAEDIGFMLAEDKNGVKQYSVAHGETQSPEYRTSDVSFANLHPTREEINMAQTDWRDGIGKKVSRGTSWRSYLKCISADGRQRNKVIPGPLVQSATGATLDGTPVRFVEKGGALYLAAGEKLYLCASGNLSETWAGVSLTITDLAVLDKLYIALGGSNLFYFSADMSTFTIATPTQSKADLFAVMDKYLGKILNPNEFKTADDPSNAVNDWSTASTIGDALHNCNSFLSKDGEWHIGKTNGRWYINTSDTVIPISKAPYISDKNFKPFGEWNESLFWSIANGGFLTYNTLLGLQDISPGLLGSDAEGYTGRIMGMAGDSSWLYACTEPDTGEYAKLLCVNRRDVEGSVDWRWQGSIAEIPLDDVRDMIIYLPASGENPELWIAGEWNGAPRVYYIVLPLNYANIEEDANYKMVPTATIDLSKFTYDVDLEYKALWSLIVQSRNLDSNTTIRADYKVDDADNFTTFDTFDTSPNDSAFFPEDTYGYGVQPRLILSGYTGAATGMACGTGACGTGAAGGALTPTVPILTGLNIKGRIESDELRQVGAVLNVAYGVKKKGGAAEKIAASYLNTRLFGLAKLHYPVKIYDYLTQGAIWMDVIPPSPNTIKLDPKDDKFSEQVYLNMLEALVA